MTMDKKMDEIGHRLMVGAQSTSTNVRGVLCCDASCGSPYYASGSFSDACRHKFNSELQVAGGATRCGVVPDHVYGSCNVPAATAIVSQLVTLASLLEQVCPNKQSDTIPSDSTMASTQKNGDIILTSPPRQAPFAITLASASSSRVLIRRSGPIVVAIHTKSVVVDGEFAFSTAGPAPANADNK